ncbi:hypothetical protein VD0001_g7821 [Verticillium dahliae]|nr:hypothetical protein VD0001_g7821 [Verticillium dahliae]
MATFFQSFRSSTMPKRLLRYALSKLELLEEETLDIENLEFALGRNTVFEFKDVGMRLKKLESLLNLPPAFRLQRAKVLKLTVTIPMDFYTSPINIEVDGVDIRLSVVGGDEDKNKERAARKTRDEPDVVPDTLDLAASFLETQPLAEKRKLEEALASESQDLGASVATADSFASEEDEPGFGTGQALSLPFFLADFLQGIIDRTQIRIRGVIFQLDVEVPSDDSTAASDIVAFQIALDQIDVEGVTAESRNNQDDPLIQPKEGKRHIALSRIRAYLISEANVFSSFSRSPSMTSPAISQAPSFSERATPSPPPTSLQTTDLRQSSHVDNLASHPSMHHNDTMEDSVELNEIDEALLRDSEDALQIPYDLADEPGPEDENTHTPRASIYEDFPGSHADSYSASKPSDNAHGLAWGEWSSEPPPDLLEEALSSPLQGSFHVPTDAQQRSDSPTGPAATEPSEDDDLARSQLFTHEEAESMYMNLEKFRLGYATDDILSFDQSLQMRTSVMDKFPSPGADVSLKLIQTLDSIRTEITTLPLLVQLDLRRLDETFSWFGGLSSFLHMSSSMTASSSPSSKSQIQSPSKPRGVHFDTPINPDDKSASSLNKVDMRIGGFNLELRGKECSVGLETSAIKMVSRASGMGFAISKARLAGPYLKNGRRDPPIMVTLGSLRFDYQNSPTAQDLERLLELIIPSKAKFDQGDNEIMVDTLLRQRRKGAVLRINLEQFDIKVSHLSHLQCLPGLGEELARLAIVAKYLPEDDRPGLLTLGKIMDARASLDLGGKIGLVTANLKEFEAAQITIPSLIAFGIGSVSVRRNDSEDLVSSPSAAQLTSPVLMVRMVGDEIEPVIKVQMRAITIDYRVPTIMDVLGLGADATPQDFEASLAASVANLGDQAHHALTKDTKPTVSRRSGDLSKSNSKPMKVDILSKDCLIGLNPLKQPSKLFIVLTDAHLEVILPKDVNTQATLHLNKASLLLTDDVAKAATVDERNTERQRGGDAASQQVADLAARGYVNICFISAAKVLVRVTANPVDGEKRMDVEMRDDLLVLETCADSTQTLISLVNALTPPTPPTKENKYRTKVVPVQNLLASIAPEAFGRAEGAYDFDEDFPMAQGLGSDDEYDVTIESGSLPAASGLYQDEHVMEEVFDAGGSPISINSAAHASRTSDSNFNISSSDVSDGSGDLDIDENYFTHRQDLDSKARIWNSKQNSYDQAPADLVRRSPLRVTVRDVHVIWHLFDGYDWARTRDEITRTVEEVQTKALERRKAGPTTYEDEEDDDTAVIGDYLFNSIYIGIPAQYDPRDLAQMVNADLNDNATYTETESVATTAFTATGTRAGGAPRFKKRLRLGRSKHHKISFELQGVNLDLIVFPPDSGETQSSIDVRVQTLEVYDMVPTSTWKKFATYDQDAGEREMNTSMVRLELLNVKPHRDLAASEMVLRVTLLPLRLHVDQDALDFITRFFEFKDDKIPVHSSPSDVPFLQRVEIMDIPVQLDFKPKRVDYGGLKSGRTTEFMNFVILDQAHMTLRHAIIYGVQGFDRMGKTLNDIWMPDVKRNQLPGVLAGLAPVRSLVNIGSGFKNLVEIPIKEYQKDGRIFRSLQMGATAFARTTGTEMVKLGAKLAIGTQTALQGAEGLLTTRPPTAETTNWDGDDPADADDHQKQISLYADQPTGVIQGLRGGYQSLMRDLHSTRDAIIAVPGEVMDSQSAQGLARVLYKRAPTIVFRPAIGASKAIGKTLIGATNSLDPQNRRRAEEKYKRH